MSAAADPRFANERRVVLYESHDHVVHLDVRMDDDTVWLTQQQMAALFGRDVTTIRRHIKNARTEELQGFSTSAFFTLVQREGERQVERRVEHYNLDMILSVGYRVKSKEGVYFRRWANAILKQHLTQGYTINQKRLQALNSIVKVLRRSTQPEISGTAEIITSYLPSLDLLDNYDEGVVGEPKGDMPQWDMTYEDALLFVHSLPYYGQTDLFGKERNGAFQGIIDGLYQTFAGHDLYPSVQSKAANLLYQVVKDHPFFDGNKRCAAALFIHFLDRNNILRDSDGSRLVEGNALAAMTLMIALSDPKEKNMMTALVENFISA